MAPPYRSDEGSWESLGQSRDDSLVPRDEGEAATEPKRRLHSRPSAAARHVGTPEDDPNLGRLLGSYRLLSRLGQGGMGTVYLAEHIKLGRRVALKLLRADYAAKKDAVNRFFQEARAVNAIGHENIVDITDYVELETGETFFIMELLQGRDLGRIIRNKDEELPVHEALEITLQVCDALEAVHEKNIIHRDLKPDNLFILDRPSNSGVVVKLLDFGVAKLVGEAAQDASWQTAAGSVLGTPAYMSPEQATGLAVDERADIYSLGAIFYEMFTGRPVYRAKSFGEFVLKHINENPIPPHQLPDAPPIPATLERMIMVCLQKDPDDRYPSVAALREDLLRATATVETYVQRRSRGGHRENRHRGALFPLLIGLLVVAGIVFWLASGLTIDDLAPTAPEPVTSREPAPSEPNKKFRAGSDLPSQRPVAKTVRLALYSQPPGASVSREGEESSLGTTPLALRLPKANRHIDLIFRLPGYAEARKRVTANDDAAVSVALELLTDASADAALPPPPPPSKTRPAPAPSTKIVTKARPRRRRPARASPRKPRPRRRQEPKAKRDKGTGPVTPKPITPKETVDPFAE